MIGNQRKTITFSILLITLTAFLLRVYRLDFFSLRGDEAFTILFVQRTWEGLWRGISLIEPNPPLMYLLLRAWVALAGASEYATRYFSVFFGVLCVPLMYRFARITAAPADGARVARTPQNVVPKEYGDRGISLLQPMTRLLAEFTLSATNVLGVTNKGPRQVPSAISVTTKKSPHPNPRNGFHSEPAQMHNTAWIALFAAALVAINPYQIWHSQDVRNYTLWPALSLASLFFFFKWWNAERQQKFTFYSLLFTSIVPYLLFALASLYTHYYDVFVLVAENIFVLVFASGARQWKTLRRWMGAQVVLVLAYAPWVLFGTNRILTYGEASAESGVSLLDQFSRTVAAFVLSDTIREGLHTTMWIPLVLGLLVILIYLGRENREQATFLLLYIAVPTIMLYIISIGRPLFNERYLNGIAPAYYLAFAIGLAALWPPRTSWHVPAFYIAITFFALASAYALANYWYDPAFAKAPDWRGLVQQINSNLREGDIIVQNFNEVSVQYYRRGNTPVVTLPRDYWFRPEDEKSLQQLNKDYRRIWFIPAQPDWWDPDQDVEKLLSRYDDREQETRLSVFRLQLYATPREFEPRMTSINAQVGAATLIGYRVERNKNSVRIVLYWRAAQKTEKKFHVFVHLADTIDRVIAQDDSVPVEGTYSTTEWKMGELIVDAHEIKIDATGTFPLFVGMYDPETNVRAPAFDASGSRLADGRVALTQVTIP